VGSGFSAVLKIIEVALVVSSCVRSRARSETVIPMRKSISAMIRIFLDLRRLTTVRPTVAATYAERE